MITTSKKIDPFTLEIVKDSLLAIGDEMFIALARTSMSPIVYEVLDYASGLTDAKGNLLTQGNGATGFIGMLTFMVKETLNKFGEQDLNPGDIIIINDPYKGGGSHLSDVGLVMPIFTTISSLHFLRIKRTGPRWAGRIPVPSQMIQLKFFKRACNFLV